VPGPRGADQGAGPLDPQAWGEVVEAFDYEVRGAAAGPACGYRQAQARLRRAEAQLAGGAAHTAGGPVEADLRAALEAAEHLGGPSSDRPCWRWPGAPGCACATRHRSSHRPRPAHPAGAFGARPRRRGPHNRPGRQALFISEKTVSVHLSRVMAKLGATSRTEAVTVAYGRGLLTPVDQELARSDP
jgi:hypothetical protein